MDKVKLGEIFEYLPKSKFKAGDGKEKGKYKFFTSSNIQNKYIDEFVYDGEYIIFGTGGKASINYCNDKFSTSTDNFVVKVDKAFCTKLIYLYFKSDMSKLEKGFKGASIKHISKEYINQLTIPKYNYNEQLRIVDELDKVQEIIDIRKKQIEQSEESIKAQFVKMFGTIDNTQHLILKMGEIANIKHGYAFKGEFFTEEDNAIVLVTPGNFKMGGGFQEDKCKFFTGEYSKEYMLHEGDLIVTMTDLSKNADTLGYGAIVPKTNRVYLHNQRIGLFENIDKRLNKVYIRWFMQTPEYRSYIIANSTGSTVHHTSPSKILSSKIMVPPIKLQNQFEDFVKLIYKQKIELQKNLEEMEKLQQSLMNKYFGSN